MQRDLQRIENVKKLSENGKTVKEISAILNLKKPTVRSILKRYNIKYNKEKRNKLNKEILQDLYVDKKLSMYRISKLLNVTQRTVFGNLKIYDIPLRGDAKRKYENKKFTLTKEELSNLYENEGLTPIEIAKKENVSESCVRYYLLKFGLYPSEKHIEKRKIVNLKNKIERYDVSFLKDELQSCIETMSKTKICEKYNITETQIKNWIDYYGIKDDRTYYDKMYGSKRQKVTKELLESMYPEKKLEQIAKELGYDISFISRKMKLYGIKTNHKNTGKRGVDSDKVEKIKSKSPKPTKSVLKKLYDSGLSISQMASIFDKSVFWVRLKLIGYGIHKPLKYKENKRYDITKDILYDLYITKNYSRTKVMSELKINQIQLSELLEQFNISKNK